MKLSRYQRRNPGTANVPTHSVFSHIYLLASLPVQVTLGGVEISPSRDGLIFFCIFMSSDDKYIPYWGSPASLAQEEESPRKFYPPPLVVDRFFCIFVADNKTEKSMKKMTEAQRKEKQREYNRKYYQEHREKIRESQRKYLETCGDDVRQRQKEAQKKWAEENREYRVEYVREWRRKAE